MILTYYLNILQSWSYNTVYRKMCEVKMYTKVKYVREGIVKSVVRGAKFSLSCHEKYVMKTYHLL